jgi:hypothetical protein
MKRRRLRNVAAHSRFKTEPRNMQFSVMSVRLPVVLAAALAFAPTSSDAEQKWTFCVASAASGGEVWITDPFASSSDRHVLELAMQSTLKLREGERVSAQCPQPSSDKVAVVNAQTTAIAFNRKLGAILHALPEREFPGADQ